MGGEVGVKWAEKYNEARKSFPPLKGQKKVGNLDWHEASLGFQFVINLIKKDTQNTCLIQLGASSGKEISYFSKTFSESEFIYTDIFEETTSYAKSKFYSSNLNMLLVLQNAFQH